MLEMLQHKNFASRKFTVKLSIVFFPMLVFALPCFSMKYKRSAKICVPKVLRQDEVGKT